MKQAILITAYRDFRHLADLVDSFDERFDVFIHLDRKSRVDGEVLRGLQARPQVKLVRQVFPVNWGGRNHVEAILWLCRRALDASPEASHFHLISGADLLLKPLDDFVGFFESHRGRSFMEYFRLPYANWSGGGLGRLEFVHPLDRLNLRDARSYAVYRRYLKWQMRKGRVRPLPAHPVYGGSTWWSLAREAVAYVCGHCDWQGWYERLKDTFVPEEMYVQTLLLNSPLRDTVVNDNLRYILWEERHGSCPAILDESDAEALLHSGAWFARKVDSDVSGKLIRTINRCRNHGI